MMFYIKEERMDNTSLPKKRVKTHRKSSQHNKIDISSQQGDSPEENFEYNLCIHSFFLNIFLSKMLFPPKTNVIFCELLLHI